jgi:hypothetical protein
MDLAKVKTLYNNTRNAIHGSEAAATSEEACVYKDVLIDVKGIFDRKKAEELNFLYWRL